MIQLTQLTQLDQFIENIKLFKSIELLRVFLSGIPSKEERALYLSFCRVVYDLTIQEVTDGWDYSSFITVILRSHLPGSIVELRNRLSTRNISISIEEARALSKLYYGTKRTS